MKRVKYIVSDGGNYRGMPTYFRSSLRNNGRFKVKNKDTSNQFWCKIKELWTLKDYCKNVCMVSRLECKHQVNHSP